MECLVLLLKSGNISVPTTAQAHSFEMLKCCHCSCLLMTVWRWKWTLCAELRHLHRHAHDETSLLPHLLASGHTVLSVVQRCACVCVQMCVLMYVYACVRVCMCVFEPVRVCGGEVYVHVCIIVCLRVCVCTRACAPPLWYLYSLILSSLLSLSVCLSLHEQPRFVPNPVAVMQCPMFWLEMPPPVPEAYSHSVSDIICPSVAVHKSLKVTVSFAS